MKITEKSRMLLKFALVITAFALIAGCSSTKTMTGSPEKGLNLSYRFPAGKTLVYKISTNNNQTMEMMGNTRETEYNVSTVLSMQLTEKKQNDYIVKITIDSMYASLKGPMLPASKKPDFSGVLGKSFTVVYSPEGKEKETIGADSIFFSLVPGQKQNIKGFVTHLFTSLPKEKIKLGSAWKDSTTRVIEQGGMDITINTQNENTLESVDKHNGYDCLKIKTTFTGTLDGSGENSGAQLTMESDIEGESLWYFDYKAGVLVYLKTSSLSEGSIVVTGPANMTIPISGETENIVELVEIK
ncbi:hypothetical protein DRQ07_07730 [candidate division KSB1 bacterium]|nr:MAG: hypothetical protein DRQ07_07730 [candidate division KSB1 bacterium]